MLTFTKDFTLQEPIPEEGIKNALEVLNNGRIHRYNGADSFTNKLEEEFAKYMGSKYCLSCASCGYTLYVALKIAGVKAGDKVLCNAYTLAPVPGAIDNAGAVIELVEINENHVMDLDDLDKKAANSTAKVLMLSHMRGHLTDMDRVMEIVNKYNLILIEDCAHTMGASWNGKKSGSFGHIACYSTQTYKHMNSGEGGLLITNDDEMMARAIVHSGSYMNYAAHTSRPDLEVFEKIKKVTPNYSGRMDNLRAGILLPQLADFQTQCDRWNVLYRRTEEALVQIPGITCPTRPKEEEYVGSSIQWNIPSASYEQMEEFVAKCAARGVQVKWFGYKEPVGFTSSYDSWQYFENLPEMPQTNKVLATLCDMRLPLTFTVEDCDVLGQIIKEVCAEMGISK